MTPERIKEIEARASKGFPDDLMALLSSHKSLVDENERLRAALAPFARFAGAADGRDDDEITSVEIECSDAETEAIKQAAIHSGVPENAFLPGRSRLCMSLDGLKVKHWRAARSALNHTADQMEGKS